MITRCSRLAATWLSVVATSRPHHQLGTDSRRRSSPEQVPAQLRQQRHPRRVLRQAAAQGVDDRDVAGARRLDQSGDPQRRVVAQLERIAEVVVEAAQHHVDRVQAAEGLEEHAVVAHGQVAALDQGVAQVARQVGVLEVGLVVRPGGQQHDARVVAVARRQAHQGVAQARRRTRPAAARGTRGRPPAGRATARCGSRARSPRRRAPGRGRRAPASARPARAPGRRRRGAGGGRRARAARGRRAGSRGGRTPRPAAAGPRAAGAAVRSSRPGSGRAGARAAPAPAATPSHSRAGMTSGMASSCHGRSSPCGSP